MAFLTKLNIVALVLILLSFCGARCTYGSSLHQGDYKQNSMWFSDCQKGCRKLGLVNCENKGDSTNMDRAAWSQSLKTAKSPPPAPARRVATRSGIATPPSK